MDAQATGSEKKEFKTDISSPLGCRLRGSPVRLYCLRCNGRCANLACPWSRPLPDSLHSGTLWYRCQELSRRHTLAVGCDCYLLFHIFPVAICCFTSSQHQVFQCCKYQSHKTFPTMDETSEYCSTASANLVKNAKLARSFERSEKVQVYIRSLLQTRLVANPQGIPRRGTETSCVRADVKVEKGKAGCSTEFWQGQACQDFNHLLCCVHPGLRASECVCRLYSVDFLLD